MSNRQGLLTTSRSFDPPLTIGVIADTHINPNAGGRMLPEQVLDIFVRAGTGLIVHLGDVNTRSVLDDLAEIAPLMAVVGNNDDRDLQYLLKRTVRFTVGSFTFGAIHGDGGKSARSEVISRFAGKVDCALFGHSHKPLIESVAGTVLLNPGSATDRRWFEHFGIGLIRVTEHRFEPELILYANPAHLANIDVSPGAAAPPSQ
jgi:putative phosphoesterase